MSSKIDIALAILVAPGSDVDDGAALDEAELDPELAELEVDEV
jgi:hypothetical protein